MKTAKLLGLVVATVLIFVGCGPRVVAVVPSGPAINYPNKIDARIAVYFTEDLLTYIDRFSISDGFCAGHTYDIMLGNGMMDAVKYALEAVFTDVEQVDTILSPQQMEKYDAFVRVDMDNVKSDVEITELTYGYKAKAKYKISITVNLYDREMKLVYPYNSTRRGTASDRITSCSRIGDIIAGAAEETLDEISTDIAQALYSSQDVREYFEGKSK